MNFAIFLLPVVITAAHYIMADTRKPCEQPCPDADCR